MENKHNRTEFATNGHQLHRKQYCFVVSICHLVKVDLKTLESNCNSKNYLANSRFVPTIDLLTCPPIQDGSKPMSLQIFFYLDPRSRKKVSLGTKMCLQTANPMQRDAQVRDDGNEAG
jgi:hypothetical protein